MTNKSDIPTARARVVFADPSIEPVVIPTFARFELDGGVLLVYRLDGDGDISVALAAAAGTWTYLAVDEETK